MVQASTSTTMRSLLAPSGLGSPSRRLPVRQVPEARLSTELSICPHSATPRPCSVLLEIAQAAMAWAEAYDEAASAAYMATSGADRRPARERLGDRSAALLAAMSKVRP